MKSQKLMAMAAAALMLTSVAGSAFAERWNDHDRVRNGVRNGSLSHRELRNIRQNNWQQRKFANRAMRDGHMNPRERQALRRMENRNDRYIRHSKHDHN